MSSQPAQGIGTRALHAGQQPDPATNARAVPLYQTTSYVFNDTEHAANLFALKDLGYIYTRVMNPTTDVLEKRIAALHGGTGALAHASGQAACTNCILNLAQPGDNIVSVSQLYGGTYNLFHYTLPKMGIEVRFVDALKPDQFREKTDAKTRAYFGEMLGNPSLTLFPCEEVGAIGKELGIPLIIDNTAVSPALVRPLEHGANIVMESTTKYIGGHGVSIGGVVVDGGNFDWGNGRFPMFTDPDPSYFNLVHWDTFKAFEPFGGINVAYIMKMRLQFLRDTGGCMSPFNAWVTLLGVETLHLRMKAHSENALRVAEHLQKHDKVAWVNYPGLPDSPNHGPAKKYMHGGFGSLVGFGLKGGLDAGRRFIEALEMFSHLANIGDAKSLAIHPATTTHSQLTSEERDTTGVSDDYVRLSVGIEDIDDILADLDQALAKS